AVVEMNEEVAAETRSRMRSRPKWNLFQKFFATLPSSRLFDVIASSIAQRGAASPLTTAAYDPLTDDQKTEIIERYKTNMGIAESICARFDIPLVYAWQPTPAYGYDLSNHVALASHFGLQGHERSGEVTEVLASDAPLRDNKNFLWLAWNGRPVWPHSQSSRPAKEEHIEAVIDWRPRCFLSVVPIALRRIVDKSPFPTGMPEFRERLVFINIEFVLCVLSEKCVRIACFNCKPLGNILGQFAFKPGNVRVALAFLGRCDKPREQPKGDRRSYVECYKKST
ncbi:MAG: hypothetical protein AAFY01_08530, partial [Pseudomonadota bacterium]